MAITNSYNNLPETRFKNARVSLLIVLVLSFVNIFLILFTDAYFLFSSYITSLVSATGAVMYYESGKQIIFLIATLVLAIITILPYLFCYLFSKKRVAWLIVALVLFAIDSGILLVNTIGLFSEGNISGISDIIMHVYVLVSLALGVSAGLKMKNTASNDASATTEEVQNIEPTMQQVVSNEYSEELASVSRVMTITRKKSFYGCAVKFDCILDGNKVGFLKNGGTVEVNVDGNAHQLIVKGGMLVSKMVEISAGSESVNLNVYLKMHAMESEIIVE